MYNKRKINKMQIVSLPQLIIDLYKEGGPAEEAAEAPEETPEDSEDFGEETEESEE